MHLHTPLSTLNEEGHSADKWAGRTYSRAMLLKGSAKSDEALSLLNWIVDDVLSPHQKATGQLRPSMVVKCRAIADTFLADLLKAASEGRWSNLSTDSGHLVGLPGGKTAFKTLRAALGSAGYLEELPGYFIWESAMGQKRKISARTSFRPTFALLQAAEDRGVSLQDYYRHFGRAKVEVSSPKDFLRLVGRKIEEQGKPKYLAVPDGDPKAEAIIGQMVKLNEYLLADDRVDGIAFAGLRRSFNDADQPGFAYQRHGRFYSMPMADHYEQLQGGSVTRQRIVRIAGKPAREVDISASQLTILHGLLEVPFEPDSDPYGLLGLEREQVKDWLVIAIGSAGAKHGGNRLKKAKAGGLERYPFLRDLPTLGIGPLDLQFHEAEIIRLAMDDLMDRGLGFLPVHDALLVADGNQEVAAEAIRLAFQRYFTGTLGKKFAPVPLVKWNV